MIVPHKALVYLDDGSELVAVRSAGSRSQAVYCFETTERNSYGATVDTIRGHQVVGVCDLTSAMDTDAVQLSSVDALNDMWTHAFTHSHLIKPAANDNRRVSQLGRYDHPNHLWSHTYALGDIGAVHLIKVDPASVAERGVRKNKAGLVTTKNPMHNTPFKADWAARVTVCGNLVQFLRDISGHLAENTKALTKKSMEDASTCVDDYNTMLRELAELNGAPKRLREAAVKHRETAARILNEYAPLMRYLENVERTAGLLSMTASPWVVYRRTLQFDSIAFEDGVFTAKGTDGSVLLSINYNRNQSIWKDKNLMQLQSVLHFRTYV